jgi:glycosyltransferase involved in cell wall biosynthesis
MKKLLIIANNNIGNGQSGGDTIFLNFIKYWQKKLKITVLGSQETKNLLKRYNLEKIKFIKTDNETNLPLLFHQIRRTIKGIKQIYNIRFKKYDLVYTVSDFYPDLIPGLFYKFTHTKTQLVAGYYLFAPNPFDSQSPYIQNDEFFKGLFYYLSQLPSRLAVNLWADMVMVTSDPDIKKFPQKKVIVVQGGVDKPPQIKSKKIYDAVFLGRLHPQKGVVGLIDIWKYVVKVKPKAKLALIGNGALEAKIKSRIQKYHLEKNVILFGFKTGIKKYKIFSQSRVALHPAIYDSGGMAVAEAMSMGLPAVSFDLKALKTYYPKGILKTKCFNKKQFAKNIINLLDNKKLYKTYALEAQNLINSVWLWSKRAPKIYKKII